MSEFFVFSMEKLENSAKVSEVKRADSMVPTMLDAIVMDLDAVKAGLKKLNKQMAKPKETTLT